MNVQSEVGALPLVSHKGRTSSMTNDTEKDTFFPPFFDAPQKLSFAFSYLVVESCSVAEKMEYNVTSSPSHKRRVSQLNTSLEL